jgi:hypothetical protein
MSEFDDLSGGELRKRLEDALGENRELKGLVSGYAAGEAIRAEGFDLVKPEDLVDVPPGEINAKAKEIQESRFAERRSTVIDVLRNTGVAEADLEGQADAMLQGQMQTAAQGQSADTAAWSRALGMSQGGAPAPQTNQAELHGNDAIAYGLTQNEARRAK